MCCLHVVFARDADIFSRDRERVAYGRLDTAHLLGTRVFNLKRRTCVACVSSRRNFSRSALKGVRYCACVSQRRREGCSQSHRAAESSLGDVEIYRARSHCASFSLAFSYIAHCARSRGPSARFIQERRRKPLCGVITTILEVNEAVANFVKKDRDVSLVVIGDHKSR